MQAIYRENDHQMPKEGRFLDQDVYGKAIGAFIIDCTDTMIINRRRRTVFLAHRQTKPMAGLWVVGGRRFPGETKSESVARTFKRETTLGFSENRFTYLREYEVIWKDRQQEPQNVGSHNRNDTFTVELTDEELTLASLSLERQEYLPGHGLKEFTRRQMVEANCFPVLIDLYDLVFPDV